MSARVVVVAGVSSGVGKTSITLGLLEALRRRGLAVQAFKIGPDFIDPGLHAVVSGRPSYNLDGWMCGRERVLEVVGRVAAGADVAVVEGVMGCFDGVAGATEEGSTAQVAKWLGAPVVLVLDAGALARSAGAVALGFERFDPALRVAGVIANRVGGAAHARWIFDAIRGACRAEPLGAIAQARDLAMPERHLGLHTAADGALTAERIGRLGDAVAQGIDLDRLLALAAPLPAVSPPARPPSGDPDAAGRPSPPRARIGVARDAAFQFYYAENLDRLRAAGAELVEWSPLADAEAPEVDGLYLGGGYPELHAARLADNAAVRKSVRRFAEAGRPIYAECGGLMFLADSLEDVAGRVHPMVGLLPAAVRMREHGLTLGYAEVTLAAATLLGPAGAVVRGQEFHASTLGPVPPSITRAYRVRAPGGGERAEGYAVGRALMSYVHLHFASCPAVATAFVGACAAR
ncbi:MAG TPA: cobyrinate a,c-diamide synthase [Candidatus Binatia bacterium]|nr:cobyrinate a,c-diamide synthase [Candidatus Binatia bacterium]